MNGNDRLSFLIEISNSVIEQDYEYFEDERRSDIFHEHYSIDQHQMVNNHQNVMKYVVH